MHVVLNAILTICPLYLRALRHLHVPSVQILQILAICHLQLWPLHRNVTAFICTQVGFCRDGGKTQSLNMSDQQTSFIVPYSHLLCLPIISSYILQKLSSLLVSCLNTKPAPSFSSVVICSHLQHSFPTAIFLILCNKNSQG